MESFSGGHLKGCNCVNRLFLQIIRLSRTRGDNNASQASPRGRYYPSHARYPRLGENDSARGEVENLVGGAPGVR